MSNIQYAVTGLTRQGIRNLTKHVRNFTQISHLKNYDIIKWFENDFIPRSDFDYDICESDYLGEDHALTDHDKKIIYIHENVYDGACKGMGRDRMTIVHEVGHAILHTPDRIKYARSFSDKIPAYQHPEWQAKAFAGEFLVPVDLLEIGMHVGEIAETFGVSCIPAEYQAKTYHNEGLIKLNGPVNNLTDPKIVWKK